MVLVVSCTGAGVALGQSGDSSARNVVATQSYLVARHELGEARFGGEAMRISAMQGLNKHVRQVCPDVLAGAPGTGGILRQEAISQLEYASLLALRPADLKFARMAHRLQWSSLKLTTAVHLEAKALTESVSVDRPDICADARTFIASKYRLAPSSTTRFLRDRAASEEAYVLHEPGRKPVNLAMMVGEMLRQYERPDERVLLTPKRISAKSEAAFVNALDELLVVLGLSTR